MRNICLILTCLILTSCYTKKGAIRRFCKTDSTQVTFTIHDSILIDSSRVDTLFSPCNDSLVVLENERIIVRYELLPGGKAKLSGTAKADTIYRTTEITKYVQTNCPKFGWLDWLIMGWAVILLVAFVALSGGFIWALLIR